MWNALQIEFMKWRRTALVWVTVAAALTAPFLAWLVFLNQQDPPTWDDVMFQSLMLFSMMMGPLIVTLIGAQSIASEYQFDTWKLSFTAPIRRSQVYLAKVLVGLIWMEGLALLVFLGAWVAGLLLPTGGALPNPPVWVGQFAFVGVGLFLLLPLHQLVTLIFRSFFVTSGFGIVATFTGLIVSSSKYVALYPLSTVVILADHWFNQRIERDQVLVGTEPVWLSVLAVTFLLPLLVNLIYVKRADLA